MEIVLIRLRPPSTGARQVMSPELAADILWATSGSGDRLEHIRARPGPRAPDIDLALFHRTGPASEQEPEAAGQAALRLCRRAIEGSPALAGWSAAILPTPPARTRPATG